MELYVLRLHDHLCGCESVNVTVCTDRIERISIRPQILIIRGFHLVAATIIKTIGWLNHLGRYEIDTKRMEASHNQHLGLRIRGMDR